MRAVMREDWDGRGRRGMEERGRERNRGGQTISAPSFQKQCVKMYL